MRVNLSLKEHTQIFEFQSTRTNKYSECKQINNSVNKVIVEYSLVSTVDVSYRWQRLACSVATVIAAFVPSLKCSIVNVLKG